jgi:hypothetical protein
MTTDLEDEIISTYRTTRKRLEELTRVTGDGSGMVIKEGVKERLLFDFFIAVKVILDKRGIGR